MTLSTSTTYVACRARPAKAVSPAVFSSATAITIVRHRQQARGFRFGRLWSAYFESNRDSCRRGRHLKYKYLESLNRRSAWEDHPLAREHKAALKRMVHNAGDGKTPRTGAGCGSLRSQRTPENLDGVLPGQNIEDAERAPMEHLLFGKRTSDSEHYEYDYWQSPLQNLRNKIRSRLAKATLPDAAADKVGAKEPDHYIEPITNRKVPVPEDIDIPIRKFKTYRSRFVQPGNANVDNKKPIFYDDAPSESELKGYREVNHDSQTSTESRIAGSGRIYWHRQSNLASWSMPVPEPPKYDDLAKYKPTVDEIDPTEAPNSPKYEDLAKYGVFRSHEPDGKYQANPHQFSSSIDPTQLSKYGVLRSHQPDGRSKRQDMMSEDDPDCAELGKYQALQSHAPDGIYKSQAEVTDGISNPSELGEYKAFRSHEPDGRYKLDAEKPDFPHKAAELDNYQAVRSHEPDGKYKAHAEEVDAPYDPEELAQYKAAVRASEPDGKYKTGAADAGEPYDSEELAQYKPVRAHEPDEKYKPGKEVAHDEYDPEELARYDAVRAHEPDGRYKVDGEWEREIDPQELARYGAYRAHEPDGRYKREPEQAPPEAKYDAEEFKSYGVFRSHEPDGKYAASSVDKIERRDESGSYEAFRSHEPDGKYRASQAERVHDGEELDKYGAFRSHEPDGKYAAEKQGDPPSGRSELGEYQPFRSHEPDGRYATEPSEEDVGPEDLASYEYEAYCSNEPDGEYAGQPAPSTGHAPLERYADFEYKASSVVPEDLDPAELRKYEPVLYKEPDGKDIPAKTEGDYDPAELEKYEAVKWNEPDGKAAPEEKTHYQKMLEDLMPEHVTATQGGQLRAADQTKKLTGNYVRDFPEEFTTSWSTEKSAEESSLLPRDLEKRINDANKYGQEYHVDGNGPGSDQAIQLALDRHLKPGRRLLLQERRQAAAELDELDPYSKDPMGLETSYLEECGGKAPGLTYFKVYGSIKDSMSKEAAAAETLATAEQEPALYKILAYDPTMQAIDIAETTSIVPDNAAPLTPAEVLLRLSNPAKFFPHFEPLQKQGFEIVSGSGDVLVFRKVRAGVPSAPSEVEATTSTASKAGPQANGSPADSTPVNPVDMTGRRRPEIHNAATRFASPTRFVNYSLPPAPAEPAPFVSGIDVRREEDVFSGPKETPVQQQKKSTSMPRRLALSAAWLGGVSYAIGVVSEYFKTGGTDGKGPRGF